MYRLSVVRKLGLLALVTWVAAWQPASAATFTVNSTADAPDAVPGDGLCATMAGNCTLRAAIEEIDPVEPPPPGPGRANATAGTDTIVFDIPAATDPGCNAGTGVCTIQPISGLPIITGPVIIDGYTQPGTSPNTNGPGLGLNTVLKIELDGSNAGATWGLNVADGNTIRGLVINRFSPGGCIDATAIRLAGSNNVIQGNFLGTDVTGTVDLGNCGLGVAIGNGNNSNTIGGITAAARNLISGNDRFGIRIFAATGNLVQGNLIGTDVTGTTALGNSTAGVVIDSASSNTVGGITATARNVISGNGQPSGAGGVWIRQNGATSNEIRGNFIGTDVTGAVGLGNLSGVFVDGAPNNTIGGTVEGAGNIISGNTFNGVHVSSTSGNVIHGNFIGTDVTGTLDLGNTQSGVLLLSASNNTVGGATAGTPNIISGNNQHGIHIFGASGNEVQGNFIGTQVDGVNPLGNAQDGVRIADFGANNNTVGGTASNAANVVAFNGGDGAFVEFGTGNSIRGNSIFSNASLGIDLGANGITPNDAGDGDTGPNNLQNFPVLTMAVSGQGMTNVEGTLDSTSNTEFRLEFFSNIACDPSNHGEGESLIGSTDVNTDDSGNTSFVATFSETVPLGSFITATASDPDGNTSEFSQCIEVVSSCGNGVLDAGEECDDGNILSCDGCSAICEIEVGFICGDGIPNDVCGEECDDGGESADCDDDCTLAECGDGNLNTTAGEECDDSNDVSCDGCSADCEHEMGFVCGDGGLNTECGEECDDGNNEDGDGCASDCTLEEPVPAVSYRGVIALVLLLLGASVAVLWRRRSLA